MFFCRSHILLVKTVDIIILTDGNPHPWPALSEAYYRGLTGISLVFMNKHYIMICVWQTAGLCVHGISLDVSEGVYRQKLRP